MKPTEYLDAAKKKLNVTSDYELAKRLDVPRQSIPAIRKGARHLPLDLAFRIAIALEMDPAQVVADLESQREKNEKRRGFWTGFISRAASLMIVTACTLVLSFTAICGSAETKGNGPFRRRLQCA